MIKPSIGRQVLYRPLESEKIHHKHNQPFAATIIHVWNDRMVNLDVITEKGQHLFKSSCTLAQDREASDGEAEWMQYQIDQQAKADAAAVAPASSPLAISLDADGRTVNFPMPDGSVFRYALTDAELAKYPLKTDQAIEKEVVAKGLTAPRVTLADLNANITDIEIVKHVSKSGQVLRWAVLTTLNGYAVVGRPSVGVSSENDDQDVGEKIAVDNSRNELWPLMGYALKEALASDGS